MLKDYSSLVAIGQAGGNIVYGIEKITNISSYYINSSVDDLDLINVDYDKKYAIENVKGMAKDVNYAMEIITSNDNDEKIAEQIYKNNPNAHIYFFVFATSGGTSGGMSTYIAEKFKEFYPDKIVNAIIIIPHSEEDPLMQINAINCLERIKKLMNEGVITNLQIIDNNALEYGKKLEINDIFLDNFIKILNFNKIHNEGNLDEEEMERIFITSGVSIINKLDDEDILNSLNNIEYNSVYSKFNKNPKVHGLILTNNHNNPINRKMIKEVFGIPLVTHDIVWDNNYSIVISSGMSFNEEVILDLKRNYNSILEIKNKVESESKDIIENINIDDSILHSLYSNKQESKRPISRKRRTEEVGMSSEQRFRKKR